MISCSFQKHSPGPACDGANTVTPTRADISDDTTLQKFS